MTFEQLDPLADPARRGRRWWPVAGLIAVAAAVVAFVVVIDRPADEADGPVGPSVSAVPSAPTTPATTTPPTADSTVPPTPPSTAVTAPSATTSVAATTPPTPAADDVLAIDLPPYAFPIEGIGPCTPPDCPAVTLDPEGTAVAFEPALGTFSILTSPPRTVALVEPLDAPGPHQVLIGPDDVAYLVVPASQEDPVGEMLVVSLAGGNAGQVIARPPVSIDLSGDSDLVPTADGLVVVGCCGAPGETVRPDPGAEVLVPWIDRNGAPIVDDRPQVRLELTGAQLEVVRADTGQRWTVPGLSGWMRGMPMTAARADGGAAIAFFDVEVGEQRLFVFEPSGTVEQLDIGEEVIALGALGEGVVFDGTAYRRGSLPTYTEPVPAMADVARWLEGSDATFGSADEVIDTIVGALQDSSGCEVPSTATVLDRSDGDPTTVTIGHRYGCDDSGAGSLIELTIAADGGAWSVVDATQRYLCLRGAAGAGLCV